MKLAPARLGRHHEPRWSPAQEVRLLAYCGSIVADARNIRVWQPLDALTTICCVWLLRTVRTENGTTRRVGHPVSIKARAYAESDAKLFVESCPVQAREIAEHTGKRVICATTAEVWN
jgi:hypothetical protein